MSDPVEFEVIGDPVPQGSVSAFVQGGRARVVHTNAKKVHGFRTQLAEAAIARDAVKHETGAVRVDILFVFSRPKGHHGTGRNAGKVKASAPHFVTKANHDVDKLARCVLDALTGVCYHDDGQVAELFCVKRYTTAGFSEHPRTVVKVSTLAEEGGA